MDTTNEGDSMSDYRHPDGCDDCGIIAPLYHNEATEASLCESCDRDADARNGGADLDSFAAELREARDTVTRLDAERETAEEALRLASARYTRAALWLRADELRRELADVERRAANITLSNPDGSK